MQLANEKDSIELQWPPPLQVQKLKAVALEPLHFKSASDTSVYMHDMNVIGVHELDLIMIVVKAVVSAILTLSFLVTIEEVL